eukprot:jgi/Botrbrau1/15837/Bobra.40_1s0021.1
MSDRDMSKANTDPVSKAIHNTDQHAPRAIRQREGVIQDPVPEGKELDTQQRHHVLAAAGQREPLTSYQEKEAVKDKMKELRHMNEDKPNKYPNLAMDKRGLDPQTGSISKANMINQRKS